MRWKNQQLFFGAFWPRGAVALSLLVVMVSCFLLAAPSRWPVLLVFAASGFAFGWVAMPFAGPKLAVAPQGIRVDGVPFWWAETARVELVREPPSIAFFPRGAAPAELRAKRFESRPPLPVPVVVSLPRLHAHLEAVRSAIAERFGGPVELHERPPAGWREVEPVPLD